MNVGIIGYGSMGKMLLHKMLDAGTVEGKKLFAANRTFEKLLPLSGVVNLCKSNAELAAACDTVFVCVHPGDVKPVLQEIAPVLKKDVLLVSLNGNIPFALLNKIADCKTAILIPSVTAEVNESQSLVAYNGQVNAEDKALLTRLLECMGDVIELDEEEIGVGSEIASCMPGFIAAIFDVMRTSVRPHTNLPDELVIRVLLKTLMGTGRLMLEQGLTFDQVVTRVATPGGITEEGVKVIREKLPTVTDEIFEKTLKKRALTTEKARESFKD